MRGLDNWPLAGMQLPRIERLREKIFSAKTHEKARRKRRDNQDQAIPVSFFSLRVVSWRDFFLVLNTLPGSVFDFRLTVELFRIARLIDFDFIDGQVFDQTAIEFDLRAVR